MFVRHAAADAAMIGPGIWGPATWRKVRKRAINSAIAGHHAGAQARQAGAFGQRMKSEKAVEAAACFSRAGNARGRRLVEINIGITFIRQHDEIIALGQREQLPPIILARHRAFGVGGRTYVHGSQPFQHVIRQSRVIGQKTSRRGRGHVKRFGMNAQRGCGIGLIEGIGHRHDGPSPS